MFFSESSDCSKVSLLKATMLRLGVVFFTSADTFKLEEPRLVVITSLYTKNKRPVCACYETSSSTFL